MQENDLGKAVFEALRTRIRAEEGTLGEASRELHVFHHPPSGERIRVTRLDYLGAGLLAVIGGDPQRNTTIAIAPITSVNLTIKLSNLTTPEKPERRSIIFKPDVDDAQNNQEA